MTSTVYLDANVLISYIVDNHSHHERAVKLLDSLWKKDSNFALSDLTMDEFWYGFALIVKEKRQTRKKIFTAVSPKLKEATESIFSLGNIKLFSFKNTQSELVKTLDLIEQHNLRPRDAFHLQTMNQHKVRAIATFDKDFEIVEKKGLIEILN